MQAEIARLEQERRLRKKLLSSKNEENTVETGSIELSSTSELLIGLQQPDNLRRAIILSEILGRPVALR